MEVKCFNQVYSDEIKAYSYGNKPPTIKTEKHCNINTKQEEAEELARNSGNLEPTSIILKQQISRTGERPRDQASEYAPGYIEVHCILESAGDFSFQKERESNINLSKARRINKFY